MIRRYFGKCWLVVFVVFLHQMAWARVPGPFEPPEVPDFVRCRGLIEDAARLTCFDQAAAAMEQALRDGKLLLVKKAKVQEARRSQFGLPESGGDPFGGEDPGELTGIIRAARSTADGWVIVLQDGSTWQQVAGSTGAIDPRAGLEVTIKRGALGSYRLVLSPHAAFKVRRVP